MSAQTKLPVGAEAVELKGWWQAHRFLVLRRVSQMAFLSLFLLGRH